MKIKKQRNIIWDIIPPQISRPLRQARGKPAVWRSKDFFASFQIASRCISVLLIGLLIFTPIFPVFAEEAMEFSEEVSDTDIISQAAAVEDEAPILPEVGSTEEKLASTTEESLINEPIVEERVIVASTTEVIIEEVIEGSGEARVTESAEETSGEAVVATSTERILISNTSSITSFSSSTPLSDISSSSPETIEDSASVANVEPLANVLDLETSSYSLSGVEGLFSFSSSSTDSTSSRPAELGEARPEGAALRAELQLATEPLNTQDPFAGKECIFLNNGNDFYCFKSNKESNASTSVENLGVIEKGKVSSIRDSDGDREIFFSVNSASIQVTNNNWDDLFPMQDVSGSSIVWQSLVNERWQIMFYAQETATTTQITDSSFNNMMPRIYGDIIVWQGWPQDNWEIFYAKKNNSGEWIVKQVTNNDYPDMFPKVMGNNIVWQAFSSEGGSAKSNLAGTFDGAASGGKDGGWHIFTYNINNNAITKISSTGIKNENPEFMIVWEEKGDGAATRAFGYDLSSGEVVELNNNEKPQEIPEPPLKNDIALSISTTTPNKLEDEKSE